MRKRAAIASDVIDELKFIISNLGNYTVNQRDSAQKLLVYLRQTAPEFDAPEMMDKVISILNKESITIPDKHLVRR